VAEGCVERDHGGPIRARIRIVLGSRSASWRGRVDGTLTWCWRRRTAPAFGLKPGYLRQRETAAATAPSATSLAVTAEPLRAHWTRGSVHAARACTLARATLDEGALEGGRQALLLHLRLVRDVGRGGLELERERRQVELRAQAVSRYAAFAGADARRRRRINAPSPFDPRSQSSLAVESVLEGEAAARRVVRGQVAEAVQRREAWTDVRRSLSHVSRPS
jgi:hypothetical protein